MKDYLSKETIEKEVPELWEYLQEYFVQPLQGLGLVLESMVTVSMGSSHGMHILVFDMGADPVPRDKVQAILDAADDDQQPKVLYQEFFGTMTFMLEHFA